MKKSKKNIKKIKLSVKNSFTFIISLIILIVAVVWYFEQKKKVDVVYSGLNEIFTGVTTSNSGELNVHFIDVGQGDCIFVEFPDGKNMLVDCGTKSYDDEVTAYLDKLGVEDITLVIATHTHDDHIGSMQAVFDNYNVGYCLRPFVVYYNDDNANEFEQSFNLASSMPNAYKCNTDTYYNFLNCILNEGCGYSYFNKDSDFSQEFKVGENTYKYEIDFLTPIASVGDISYRDSNDYSPIFILTYGEFSMMFTGDAGEVVEEEFLFGYTQIPQIDVLKVGHHGSATSSTQAFVEKVSPEHAVIMCGEGNSYGHPTQEAITRLSGEGANIWRTDLQGNISFTIEVDGLIEYGDFITDRFANATDLITGAPPKND
ncbi:MAG: MBL fold metallo-hydrolase [Clostridia bacterium]|nr:MBL fold metallo-hydrolase [Clostridia bacterium]